MAHDTGRVAGVVTSTIIINGVIRSNEIVLHGDVGSSHGSLGFLLLPHHWLGHVERTPVLVFGHAGPRDVRVLSLQFALKFVLLVAIDQ